MKYTIDITVNTSENPAPASLGDELTAAVQQAVGAVSGVASVDITLVVTEELPEG